MERFHIFLVGRNLQIPDIVCCAKLGCNDAHTGDLRKMARNGQCDRSALRSESNFLTKDLWFGSKWMRKLLQN